MKRTLALIVVGTFAVFASIGLQAQTPTKVGADKCAKMCHKVQYQSWLETKHAKAKPPTDCETCHGAGSDFMKFAHAKDPAKAKAAGMNAHPDKTTCTKSGCHKAAEFKDDMLTKVHAHKAKS